MNARGHAMVESNSSKKTSSPPTFIYGTAWKEDDTQRCVRDALQAGFRAIDTNFELK